MCSSLCFVVVSAANANPVKTVAAFFVSLALLASTAAAQGSDSGDFYLEYTGSTGNISLWFTGTGTSGAGPVGIQTLDIITLGDTSGGNPPMPSGIPGVTAGQGGLNAAVATLPSASFQTLNNSASGLNGIYSQVFNSNIGTSWRTFDLTNPGVSNRLNLGNIAPTGWSQSVINTIFMTDPDVYGVNSGKFGYALAGGSNAMGSVVAAVPEPTTTATLAVGALLGVCLRRRAARGDA